MKMHIDFTGKRVLVTGATSPVGRGAVAGFLANGATVAVHGDDPESAARTVAELGGGSRLIAVSGRLSTAEGCKKVVADALGPLGGLDVLVNAASAQDPKRFEDVTPENWDATINGTFKAALFCTQQATTSLKASGGNVINIATIAGLMGGDPGTSAVSAASGSIVNLTRMAALRLGVDGIRVNCICRGSLEEAGEAGHGDLPMIGRRGTVADLIGSILFLASPHASFMTGSILVNDGGVNAGR